MPSWIYRFTCSIIGGGGEGGFGTRTPEINVKTLIESGITSVVGCLGTDSVCRNMETLLAKANALEEEGITAYCYTGSYDISGKDLNRQHKERCNIDRKDNRSRRNCFIRS